MISIRQAGPADNEGILELTAMTPMDGRISIRIDRYPDFFSLLHLRGPNNVFIAEKDDRIIGSISSAEVETLLDGKKETVHYIGDLKVHPEYMGTRIALKLALELYGYLRSADADYLFCTAALGNQRILPFFEGRAGLPKFENLGHFNVYQLVPSRKRKAGKDYTIEEWNDAEQLQRIYSTLGKTYRLVPIPTPGYIKSCKNFVARQGKEVRACISLFDPFAAKQNVLVRLPFFLSLFVSIIRILNNVSPLMHLPGRNQPIRILYVGYLSCQENHVKALEELMDKAVGFAFENGYNFLSVGLHSRDPLIRLVKKYRKFKFQSIGLITSLKNHSEAIQKMKDGLIFEDYSLV
ncbi:MAG: GNAT family N-acetyltransferase [Planctomycetota bacterium]|jgi:ribosomal protein S18 acetylase RimI-like enzyme